ncbi:YHYH domain-containing protein [Candidatus Accumulibacter phosphatis]|uniref:YHYH domain-containing protein n=1 Tax=Candidatus Accumulibacter phosphatis TaxID=327160 RepID=A0ABX1U139_9PROT|nr:YHYH domain-containing protein [Candidatus Accumulibacter phosphatis]NMQ29316.1 YHYH domain-containing protein [Candidatus Accumulibacter phosphatis]
MKTISLFFAIAIAVVSGSAIAHSGGTDSKGCHTDHKTGGYHCH